MKKLIIAVLVMFIGATSFSQGIDIDLGIKAGPAFSNMRNLNSLNMQYKIGLQAGVFVGVNFSERIGVQADLLYSDQGAIMERTDGNFDLRYINLPVVLKYYLVPGEGFSVQIGPQIGYLLESNLRAVYNGVEIKAEANETDISGVIGVGYEFYNGFILNARFHLGFSDVSEDAPGRHKSISLMLGYSFL